MKKYIITLLTIVVISFVSYWYWGKYLSIKTVPMIWANTTANEIRALVIKRHGIDKKHGINLENRFYNPGDLERRINEREVDTGIYGLVNLDKAIKEGKHFVVYVADLHANQFIVVKKDSSIRTIEDLRGKRLAMQPRGAAGYVTVGTVLKEYGINIEGDFKLLFGSNKDLVDFLVRGDVDAALAAYPAIAPLMASGNYRVLSRVEDLWKEKFGRTMPFVVIVAHEDWFNGNRKTAKKIVNMWLEGGRFIKEHPEIILEEKEALERMGIKTEEARKLLIEHLPGDIFIEWNNSIADDARFLLQKAIEAGFFPRIPLDNLFVVL